MFKLLIKNKKTMGIIDEEKKGNYMVNECDGRARMSAAKLLTWFYGLKSSIEEIAQFIYVHENQWYLSGQDIYTHENNKDPNFCRWEKTESEDLCAWLSDDDCVFYTFVDPVGSFLYLGPGITPEDKGFNKQIGIGEICLRKHRSFYNEQEKENITCGLIDIITKRTWKIDIPCPLNILESMDKWRRLEALKHQIEINPGVLKNV